MGVEGGGGGGRGRGLREKHTHKKKKNHGHIAKTEDATSGGSTAAICVTAQPRERVKNRRCNIWRQYCCNMRNCTTKRKSQTRKHKNQDHTEKSGLKRKPNYHRQMEPPPPPPPSRIPLTRAKGEGRGKEGGLSGAVRLNSVKRTHSRVIELPNMETAETHKNCTGIPQDRWRENSAYLFTA